MNNFIPLRVVLLLLLFCVFSITAKLRADDSKLPLAVLLEVKPRVEVYLKVRRSEIKSLAEKYDSVIESRLNKAADAGDLKSAEAFQGEKERLDVLKQALEKTVDDPIMAAKHAETLTPLAAETPANLLALRKIWITEWKKIRRKLSGELQQSLRKLESDLTKARDFSNAKEVRSYRESLLNAAGANETLSKDSGPSVSMPNKKEAEALTGSSGKLFENSLGMRFAPVPIAGGSADGQELLFSIWETRLDDYKAFLKRNRKISWTAPDYSQKGDHAVVRVLWADAVAFCSWLTEKEHKNGKLAKDQIYRLPTDHEWSCAVGIGEQEEANMSASAKKFHLEGVYPWGRSFPPPEKSGNYYGEECKSNPFQTGREVIPAYDDGFERTAPVGSFPANQFGLYDMEGNVTEWCQSWYNPSAKTNRVFRGGGWHLSRPSDLKSAARAGGAASFSSAGLGFRIVIGSAAVK